MTTPVSDPDLRDQVHALLAQGDHAVTVIHDSAGFVNQRVVATVVNIACDIAQQRIAVPDDIDKAVRLGLGYPNGPLAMGDAVGGPLPGGLTGRLPGSKRTLRRPRRCG